MNNVKRPLAFWIMIVFLSISLVLLLMGQTLAIIDYDLAVQLGLQESSDKISEYGVQINRSLGAGDTIIYIPLILISITGLIRKRRWSLPVTGAVMGISAYWATTAAFMFVFLPGVPNYHLEPGLDYWLFVGSFISFGLWGLLYLLFRGEKLLT